MWTSLLLSPFGTTTVFGPQLRVDGDEPVAGGAADRDEPRRRVDRGPVLAGKEETLGG